MLIRYIDKNNSEISVESALNNLYIKAGTYKNLTTPTSIQSTDLLLNKKAYNSDETLVTGSIGTYGGLVEQFIVQHKANNKKWLNFM